MLKQPLIDGLIVTVLVAVGSLVLDRDRLDDLSLYVLACVIGVAYAAVSSFRLRRKVRTAPS